LTSIYSFDEASFRLETQIKKVVTQKGDKPVLMIEKSFKSVNVLAAIRGNGEVVYQLMEGKQSKYGFMEFLGYLKHYNEYKPPIVTLDNSNMHRNKEVYSYIAQNNIFLHFQPTHSPFLNGVEELWRQLRIWLSHRLYKTVDRLRSAILNFFVHNQRVKINIVSYLC